MFAMHAAIEQTDKSATIPSWETLGFFLSFPIFKAHLGHLNMMNFINAGPSDMTKQLI
jgi:hypothetical protein